MNSLNLRVSSIKTGENIRKNAEVRTSIINLTKPFEGVPHTIFKGFTNAKTISEQVSFVEKLNKSCEYSSNEKTTFLCELYFNSPLKHPVRNKCCKLIQSYPHDEQILGKLKVAIQKLLANQKMQASPQINFIIISLSECFDNFQIGKSALQFFLKEIIELINLSIPKYLNEISLTSSPSSKNELYLYIHNSIRVFLSCIQEYFEDFNNKIINIDKYAESLKNIGRNMIEDCDIPMDIKTNIGILMAYFSRIFNEYDSWIANCVKKQSMDNKDTCYELCILIGIINTLKESDLQKNFKNIINGIEILCSLTNYNSSEQSFLLAGTRGIIKFSNLLISFNIYKEESSSIESCCKTLLNFTFLYLDHHLDSIRHLTRDLLKNILQLSLKYQLKQFQQNVYLLCLEDEFNLTLKSLLITHVIKVFGTKHLVTLYFPNILSDFFTDTNIEKNLNVVNCLENLILTSHSELNQVEWETKYVDFLIDKSNNFSHESKRVVFENLINKCIKISPELISYLLEEKKNEIGLNLQLSILSTIRKNGLHNNRFGTMESNEEILKMAIVSISDDTRISVLKLLTECQKSTEELIEFECNLFISYLKFNSNCQSPGTRQKIIDLSLKFLTRFERNLKKILKLGRRENEYRNLHFYFQFLKRLLSLLFSNLFSGANFSRRYISLELLKKTVGIVVDNKLNLRNFIPSKSLNNLFSLLDDSYESNKNLSLDILKILINANYGEFLINESHYKNLVTSLKPTNSVTAAYYLEFYCCICDVTEFTRVFGIESHVTVPEYEPVKFCALEMVLKILKNGLHTAKKSILIAAVTNPLYGCLLSIKHLIMKLNFQLLTTDKKWLKLIKQIIDICEEASNVVSPIVNSSTPEGYFPVEELKQFSSMHLEVNPFNPDILIPTPQMILILGWRTIKEVSLILGEFCLKSPIKDESSGDAQSYLLVVEQILEIGSHFKQLLSETKHRGAFEQAYVGFTKLCSRLWCSNQLELNSLPMRWLNELIEIISGDDEKMSEKICATRRSAGVPFMVQALITSELQLGTTRALEKCVKKLFEICQSSQYSTESKTHSLNILRTLFRCCDLNEVCNKYVSDGVICAIRGYSGTSWSEKNSSTLLFAALMTRIFGVQLTKDTENLNIRNKMTGRIFFLRYPKLFDFILEELQEAKQHILKNHKATKLQPLLLILSRLYPSALEGTESHLKISGFIDHISSCSASREFQTRILVAKAIVNFVSMDLMEKRIYDVLNIIRIELQNKQFSSNYFHGLLLQIFHLVKTMKHISISLLQDLVLDLISYENYFKFNPVIVKSILDIFNEILLSDKAALNAEILNKMTLKRFEIYLTPEYSKYFTVFRRTLCIFMLQHSLKQSINLLQISNVNQYWNSHLSADKNINFLKLGSIEKTETLLNVILLILYKNVEISYQIIDEFECHKLEINFVSRLSTEFIQNSCEYFKTSNLLKEIIKEIINLSVKDLYKAGPEILTKSFAILAQIDALREYSLDDIVSLGQRHQSDVEISIALMVYELLNRNIIDSERNKIFLLQYVRSISQPWNNFSVRLLSAMILKKLIFSFENSFYENNELFITEFSSLVLYLLMDDDSDVRELVSKIVVEICPHYAGKYENFISTYSQHIFLERLTQLLTQHSIVEKEKFRRIFREIIKISTENFNKTCSLDVNEFEVFDKNEVNIFAEQEKIILDLSEIFYEKYQEKLFLEN